MMKYLIKCRIYNELNFHKFSFKIYDLKGNFVYEGKTDLKGEASLTLPKQIYIIKIFSENLHPKVMTGIINKPINQFCFIKLKAIFINLTDQNYPALPIKKGEIILWPNHTL